MVTPVKSAVRVLQVLELFQRRQQPLTLKQICAMLGYPQSSGTVLLKNLVTHGYLNFDRATRRYFPTLRVAALGDWINASLFGQGEVFELMRSLHSATGETVSIALQNDVYIQYIRVILSVHPVPLRTDEGSMRPLTQSASGWLLMSVYSDRIVEKLVRRANIATPRVEDRQPVPLMIERVREARRTAAAYAEDVPQVGRAHVCVLLPATVQGRAVVLGMAGAVERIRPNRDRYLALAKELADSLLILPP